MSTIAIIGATGYAGSNITTEALSRGHQIISVSRNAPVEVLPGVEVRTGSIEDSALVGQLFADADVVVIATHALSEGQRPLLELVPALLGAAAEHTTRLGVVGGAGSLLVGPDGPRLVDTPEFPDEYKGEASSHAEVLEALRGADTTAQWFYVSPAAIFGSYVPGERTGTYRTTDDLLLMDPDGTPAKLSGADFAIAVVDEIETPQHRNVRFGVAN